MLLICACGSQETAASTPSPSPSASATASPTPSPTGDEAAVPQQVLPPASDLPVAKLCSAAIATTADGNAYPLLCRNGALNVRAWQYYSSISASVLGLGLVPTEGQVEAAICDDLKHNHATRPEESNGYALASKYYGWTFAIDVSKLTCQ